MTEPFWTKERRDDYKALFNQREYRRKIYKGVHEESQEEREVSKKILSVEQ